MRMAQQNMLGATKKKLDQMRLTRLVVFLKRGSELTTVCVIVLAITMPS